MCTKLCQNVYKTVSECVQKCARMCTKLCQNVYKNVPECVQKCARKCTKMCWNVYKTVPECVQNCARMCTKLCQNVYKTVSECVQNCARKCTKLCQNVYKNCAGMCAKTVPEKYTYTPSASCNERECCGLHQRFGSPQCQPLQAHLGKELPHHLLFISCDMATSSAAERIVQLRWRILRRRLSVLPPATVGR